MGTRIQAAIQEPGGKYLFALMEAFGNGYAGMGGRATEERMQIYREMCERIVLAKDGEDGHLFAVDELISRYNARLGVVGPTNQQGA